MACADSITATLDVVAETQERYATVQAFEHQIPVLRRGSRLPKRLLIWRRLGLQQVKAREMK
jgi:hypothetical protein